MSSMLHNISVVNHKNPGEKPCLLSFLDGIYQSGPAPES